MPAAAAAGAYLGGRAMLALYLGLLVWAPIPLGSNRPWSAALLQVCVLLLALWWLAGALRASQPLPRILRDAWPMLLCAGSWVGYAWLQLLPLPVAWLEMLSPQAAAWHVTAHPQRATAPLSLDPHATLEAACASTAYVAFLLLGLALLGTHRRILAAAVVLVLSGIAQAAYGAIASLSSPGEYASGSFVNRNHYAAYLVICLSIGIGLLIATLSGERHASWREFLRRLLQWMVTPKMGLRLGLMAMVIALVMTHSRMGNASFFVALLAAGVIGLVLSRRATRSMVVLIASLIAIDLLVVGTYFGAERVVQRVAESSAQAEDRDEVAGYALSMWRDYPLTGSGLGTFHAAFPRYSGEATAGAYTHAHNDYLEFAAEAGLIGLGLLGAMVVLSFVAALRAHQLRRDPLMRGLSFGAMMSIIALMMHSAVDFSLRIPANALTFMLVLAFAWISRLHGNGAKNGGPRAP
ncbi:MAG: O-antigen ligase family protein [Burkholderiales bacterium]